MYELKKIGKVFTSKFVGTGPSSYKKRIYRAAVSQRLRNTPLGGYRAKKKNRKPVMNNIITVVILYTNKCAQFVRISTML